VTSTIRHIWNQVYTVWTQRCQRNHGTDATTKRKQALLRLQPQVEQLYDEHASKSRETEYIFKQTIKETLALPVSAIESWVFKAKIRLKKIQKQIAHQSKKILPIHPFFTIKNIKNTKRKKSKQKSPKKIVTKVKSLFNYFWKVPRQNCQPPTTTEKDDLYPP
jgi:hypothetical protein